MVDSNLFCINLEKERSSNGLLSLATDLFAKVFRTDFHQPGFALVKLNSNIDPLSLRSIMLQLKEALAEIYQQSYQKSLTLLSMGRYDQQETTKFHLDGGPDESFLMIGYEPSRVKCIMAMADFTQAANNLGIATKTFLADYHPMFSKGEKILQPYITEISCFDEHYPQILLINNSCLDYSEDRSNQLGVMHRANITHPMPTENRVINSVMMAATDDELESGRLKSNIEAFIHSNVITRKPYEQ